jgi:hypothetical protein
MNPKKINITVSPEVLKEDFFLETYNTNTFGVYSGMSYVLSGGTGGTSLLTGLTIPILIEQSINDLGYYSDFDGFIGQQDIVTNFVFSGNPLSPYNVVVYNTAGYNFQSYLSMSSYKINWGDFSETSTLGIQTLSQAHTYATVPQTYTITFTQTNPWGITEVKKQVTLPFTGVTVDNMLGEITFTQQGGNWSGIPISYDYIFTGDSENNIQSQLSSNFTQVPFILTGYTNSSLKQLKRWGPQSYSIGYILSLGGQSIGYVSETTPTYTAYTINDINYIDFNDGKTVFIVSSSGVTSNDIVASAITKNEVLLEFVMDPEIQTDILIERGIYSAFESLERLGEVDNIGDLERYGYGFFKININ